MDFTKTTFSRIYYVEKSKIKYENNFLFILDLTRPIFDSVSDAYLLESYLFKKMFNPNRFVIFPDNISPERITITSGHC